MGKPGQIARNRRLTPRDVAEIRHLGGKNRRSQGRKADHPTYVDLGARFGVAPSCVAEIVAGRAYREVAGGR